MDKTIQNRVGEVYEPFQVRFLQREIGPLAPDEVLVKVRASAICGSDLHIARGLHPSAPLPVTIGHEFAGDVAAVGSAVTAVQVGRRVTVEPCIVCGKCEACRHGDYGYCEHISFTSVSYTHLDVYKRQAPKRLNAQKLKRHPFFLRSGREEGCFRIL